MGSAGYGGRGLVTCRPFMAVPFCCGTVEGSRVNEDTGLDSDPGNRPAPKLLRNPNMAIQTSDGNTGKKSLNKYKEAND